MRSLARRARPAVPNYVGDLSLIRLRLSRFASTCIRGAAGDRRGAAGVSAQFRQPTHLLLTKPAAATAMGWGGEVWNLRGAPHGFLGHQAATANSSSTVSTTTANSTDSTRGGGGKTGTTGTRDEGGGDGREKWARGAGVDRRGVTSARQRPRAYAPDHARSALPEEVGHPRTHQYNTDARRMLAGCSLLRGAVCTVWSRHDDQDPRWRIRGVDWRRRHCRRHRRRHCLHPRTPPTVHTPQSISRAGIAARVRVWARPGCSTCRASARRRVSGRAAPPPPRPQWGLPGLPARRTHASLYQQRTMRQGTYPREPGIQGYWLSRGQDSEDSERVTES